MKEVCLWKKLLDTPDSTTGQSMKKRDIPCIECAGEDINCKKYFVKKPVNLQSGRVACEPLWETAWRENERKSLL